MQRNWIWVGLGMALLAVGCGEDRTSGGSVTNAAGPGALAADALLADGGELGGVRQRTVAAYVLSGLSCQSEIMRTGSASPGFTLMPR